MKTLTGRTRLRVSRWTGKVIIQVEVKEEWYIPDSHWPGKGIALRWQDATIADLSPPGDLKDLKGNEVV